MTGMMHTAEELESRLGERLRALRLLKNMDQATVAARAGISVGALKNLEGGRGTTVKTLIRVVRVLGREEWLAGVAPIASINPLTVVRNAQPRQRARRAQNKATHHKGESG
jgi:transcriptional regulator with XRE-family HTH domain